MRPTLLSFARQVIFVIAWLSAGAQEPPPAVLRPGATTTLWYRQPAASWNEALPVGTGRLGAMIFGGVAEEHVQLNEETLWTGGPYDPVVRGASTALPEIRRLLFSGDVAKAHDLFGRRLMGIPYEQMKYQPLGDLLLRFPGHATASAYRRELDVDDAIARVTYRVDGVTFTRTLCASSGVAMALPFATMRRKASSCATSQRKGTASLGAESASSGSGRMRVHRITESGSGEPEATPRLNG